MSSAKGTFVSAQEERDTTGVALDATVSPVGASGFFVEGVVAASIRVECDRCGCVCVRVTKTPVNAWLDENAERRGRQAGDVDAVPFPRTAEECDLTSLLRDVVRLDAPYETFCDACLEANDAIDDTNGGICVRAGTGGLTERPGPSAQGCRKRTFY